MKLPDLFEIEPNLLADVALKYTFHRLRSAKMPVPLPTLPFRTGTNWATSSPTLRPSPVILTKQFYSII
jgi:hypothetical protein